MLVSLYKSFHRQSMELLDSKTIRSEGAKAGLVFGTISGGYIFLSQWLSGLGDTGGTRRQTSSA